MYEHCKRNKDGERDLCRHLLTIAIRDAISGGENKYVKKNRRSALKWFKSKSNEPFSFNMVIEYIYGVDFDTNEFRRRILCMIENKEIIGTKNLEEIFKIDKKTKTDVQTLTEKLHTVLFA